MAWLAPDVGEVEWLKRALYGNAGSENLTQKLYKASVTYAESDTAGTYTECDFTNYVAKTLTSTQAGATWAVPTTSSGTTSSSYGTTSSWTCGASGNTVYGQYIVGATSTVLLLVDAFSAGLVLTNGGSLSIIPKIGLE